MNAGWLIALSVLKVAIKNKYSGHEIHEQSIASV